VLYDVSLGVPVELETGKLNAACWMDCLRVFGFLGREGSADAGTRTLELTDIWVPDAGMSIIGRLVHYLPTLDRFRRRSALRGDADDLAQAHWVVFRRLIALGRLQFGKSVIYPLSASRT
jgi:hypothetical protein